MATADTTASGGDQQVVLDDEAKALKLELVKAETRKAIAEARKDELSAELPTSDIEPLEGKVELGEGVGLVPRLVAHQLLDTGTEWMANGIADALRNVPEPRILIVEDRNLLTADWRFAVVRGQLVRALAELGAAVADLSAALDESERTAPKTDSVSAALTGASAILGSAASLVGMFRTNYSVSSASVEVGTTPLAAAIASRLVERGWHVRVQGFQLIEATIVREFMNAGEKRDELGRLAMKLEQFRVSAAERRIKDRRAEITDATSKYHAALSGKEQIPRLDDLAALVERLKTEVNDEEVSIAEWRARVEHAKAVIERFDAFATAVTLPGEDGAPPPIVSAAAHERLHSEEGHTHVLYSGIESSGGETITRRSLFRRSGQVGAVGGAQISYLLLDVATNSTVAAGTHTLLGHLKYGLDWLDTTKLQRIDL